MKLKRLALRALGSLMSVALVACMLASCSKKDGSGDKLVENVPASALMVFKVNPQQIVENAGCSVDNGKIVLSEKYSNVIKENAGAAVLNMVNNYLSYTEGINLDAIMIYATADGKGCGVGTLSDAEPVKKRLKELIGNQKEDDGFTVYKENGMVVAIKDNMIWFSESLGTIKKQIEKAKEGNIASVKGAGELLADDNAMAFVINLPEVDSKLKAQGMNIKDELLKENVPASLAGKIADVMGYYACGSFKLDGNVASGEMFLVNKEGERSQFGKLLNVIDTDFLKNVPGNTNAVMAFGNIADPDVKKVIDDAAAEYASKPYNTEDAKYLDLLTKWDGTAALALEYNALAVMDPMSLVKMSEREMIEFVAKNIKFMAMAHYPADVTANYTGMLCDFFQTNGVAPVAAGDGLYSVQVPDAFNLYFGNRNGYLSLANYDTQGNGQSLADKFTGKRFVLYSRSDANPTLASFGWNFGSESELWLEADALKFRTELTGTSANFLQAIIEPLTDMDNLQKMMQYFMQLADEGSAADDYLYGYDDYSDDYSDDSIYAQHER